MSQNGDNNDDDDDGRKDLTRLEDLSEFLHELDDDLEEKFDGLNRPPPPPVSIEALDDDFGSTTPEFGEGDDAEANDETDQTPPELPADTIEFDSGTSATEEDSFGDIFASTEESNEEDSNGTSEFENSELSWDTAAELEASTEESSEDTSFFDTPEEASLIDEFAAQETYEPIPVTNTEKFEDVKTFAQNFSYGQSSGGGNPPFSIIVRNIKYQDDAEDILRLLREFALLTSANEAETMKALEFGSLLIPQISEYCAIILAHKLRRFDLDLDVGLSDEIHPSKSGESNPRGLVKKENLKQNKSEAMNFEDKIVSFKDILVSTSDSVAGYKVIKHLGVQTTFTLVEEDELERLSFVDRKARDESPLYEVKSDEDYGDISSDQAFKNYHQSFSALYDDLANQLKQKALGKNANALLGISFHMDPLQFDRREKRINAYQITCSATLAQIAVEDA